MIIYGLFDCSYDYHTFETFIKASKKIGKLEKLCEESIPVAFTEDVHQQLAADEVHHYYITQLVIV